LLRARTLTLLPLALPLACSSVPSPPLPDPGADDETTSIGHDTSDSPAAESGPVEGEGRPAGPVGPRPTNERPASAWEFYRERYDGDGDGSVSRTEYTRSEDGFRNLDANGDGVMSAEDFGSRWDDSPRVSVPNLLAWGEAGPRVGDLAPDFRLTSTAGEELDLGRFRGKKPVVLAFGSFT